MNSLFYSQFQTPEQMLPVYCDDFLSTWACMIPINVRPESFSLGLPLCNWALGFVSTVGTLFLILSARKSNVSTKIHPSPVWVVLEVSGKFITFLILPNSLCCSHFLQFRSPQNKGLAEWAWWQELTVGKTKLTCGETDCGSCCGGEVQHNCFGKLDGGDLYLFGSMCVQIPRPMFVT